jgi:hypothetical protein
MTFEHSDVVMPQRSLVVVNAKLELKNCRLLAGGLGGAGHKAEIAAQDSVLIMYGGIGSECTESFQCRLQNCVVRSYLALLNLGQTPTSHITFLQNTIYNESGGGGSLLHATEKATATVIAEGNILHHRDQAELLTHPNWREAIDWQGKNNLYSGHFFGVQNDKQEWRSGTVEEWSQLWRTPETGSRQTYQFEPLFVHTTLMRLDELRDVVEPVVQAARERHQLPQLGCDWDLVGPGEAYVRAGRRPQTPGAAPRSVGGRTVCTAPRGPGGFQPSHARRGTATCRGSGRH